MYLDDGAFAPVDARGLGADNLALRRVAERACGRHVVTSWIEHISVLNCARDLAKRGFEVTYVAVDGEGRIDPRAVAASSGSAGNALTGEPSHVLLAIGASGTEAESSLCFTLGRWTTEGEIDRLVDVLPRIVGRLRALSGR